MTKKREIFELDQQAWTTYSKFKLMHDIIDVDTIDNVIAVENEVST